jgi:hypothetical protein
MNINKKTLLLIYIIYINYGSDSLAPLGSAADHLNGVMRWITSINIKIERVEPSKVTKMNTFL